MSEENKEKPNNLKTIVYIHSHLIGQFTNMVKALHGRYNQIFVCCVSPELENMSNILCVGKYNDTAPEENGSNILGVLAQLRNQKIYPDIFVTQVGTGVGMYLHTLYPDVPRIGYTEWFYPMINTTNLRKNNIIRNELEKCSVGVAPTINQRNQLPPDLRRKTFVIHEGINTDLFVPNPIDDEIPSPATLDDGDDRFLITYVSRGLEPTRGFLEFVNGVKKVFETGADISVKIIGCDKVFYTDNPEEISFQMEAEKILDEYMEHVEFKGSVKQIEVRELMQKSDLHVYFTKNYALSWSFLESMAMGCLVLGSDTPPIQEFINNDENGVLVDFQSADKIKDSIIELINMDSEKKKEMKTKARETVIQRVAKDISVVKWEYLIQSLSTSTIYQH